MESSTHCANGITSDAWTTSALSVVWHYGEVILPHAVCPYPIHPPVVPCLTLTFSRQEVSRGAFHLLDMPYSVWTT